jgi:hypothetical protein
MAKMAGTMAAGVGPGAGVGKKQAKAALIKLAKNPRFSEKERAQLRKIASGGLKGPGSLKKAKKKSRGMGKARR